MKSLLYYVKQIPRIPEWMVKKGYCGKKAKLHYYIGTDKYICDYDSEWDEEVERIKKDYNGIRVWRNNCGSRIGEFLPRVRMMVRYHREHKSDGYLDIMFDPDYALNNHALVRVLERSFPIIHEGNISKWTYILLNIKRVDFSLYNLLSSKDWDISSYKSSDYRDLFELSDEEFELCKDYLAIMGVDEGDEYVCFGNRDSAFLVNQDASIDWTYHNYRNTNIHNYDCMIEYLLRNDIKSIRIGKYCEEKYTYSGCIDYPNDYYQELMDIYLPLRALFCVVPAGGINDLPLSVNDRVLLVNVVPQFCKGYGAVPRGQNNIQIFKKLYSTQSKRFLTLAETAEADNRAQSDGAKYSEMGLVYVENTADEILQAVIEMRERILGTWTETIEDRQRQERFIKFREDTCNKFSIPDAFVYNCRVGSQFLKNNWYWMGL